MSKSPAEKKSKKIKQAITNNFIAAWDDAWMDLNDLSQEQCNDIYLTLTTVNMIEGIHDDVSSNEASHVATFFMDWFFSALAPRLTMQQVVNVLTPGMVRLCCFSLKDARLAVLCQEGFAALIRRHPDDLFILLKAFRIRFNLVYDSNMRVSDYDTPFYYFMWGSRSTQSILLISLAEVYMKSENNRYIINELLWEKRFNFILDGELFKFIQASRQREYMPLTDLRRILKSGDIAILGSRRLSGPLRHLLDEINYALAKEQLPDLIERLSKPKPSISVRLFSSKFAQLIHKHRQLGDEIYSYREVEHLVMLYISRHEKNGQYKKLFGENRLGEFLSHIPDFHNYMEFISNKNDITLEASEYLAESEVLASSDEVSSVVEKTSESSSSGAALKMSA